MSSAADFDFFIGEWRVAHRRLKRRLAACLEWEHFGGVTLVSKMLGGQGNMDDNVLQLPAGEYRAATFRCFDPETRQWAIWWLDARHPHELGAPMIGGFEAGSGVFYTDETIDGRPIRVRFLWTPGASPRWEQALSPDDGASWETNWVMDFTRLANNGADHE